ncbi:MAG TPA: TonB-dependent receptor, partial [Hyphomicrobiaceae bacterium]|nr:TonB-dependent receptor [Hyphomicrobiaceae bacterium]
SYAFEWRGEFAERVFLSASVREDDNEVFGAFTTWRAASSVWLYRSGSVGIRPHASVGTGVKVPTMFEQFGIIPGFFTPNPSLRPETSFGWDGGVELSGFHGRAILDVTYFNQTLEDRIETVFAPVWTAVNRPGDSHREGVEVAARFRPFDAFMLGLSYTYLDATYPDGAREIRRAPHSGRVDAGYLFDGGRGSISVAAIYNGRMDDAAFRLPFFTTERVALSDYWLVTAGASYKLQPGLEIYGRVENLLDQRYQEVYGFNTPGIAAY